MSVTGSSGAALIFLPIQRAMKKNLPFAALLLLSFPLRAQKPYRLVLDVTSGDTLVHQMVVRWLGETTSAHPDVQVEVVFYAAAVDMVTQSRSVVGEALKNYVDGPNVTFNVCEIALKNRHVSRDQLLAGIGTVPDGIYEIAQRQYEGWAYIKAAR